MRESTLKALLWQGVGLLFYLGGMLLFLVVGVDIYLSPPRGSLANFSGAHLLPLLASIALIAVGRLIGWKLGGDLEEFGGPERSRLAELGYRIPPEEEGDGAPGAERDREFTYRDGRAFVVCPECGEENDPEFTYCRNCSTELPDEGTAFG